MIAEEDEDYTCDRELPIMTAYEFLAETGDQTVSSFCTVNSRPPSPSADRDIINAYEFLAETEAQIPLSPTMDAYEFLAEMGSQISLPPRPAHVEPSSPSDNDAITSLLVFPGNPVTPETYLSLIQRLVYGSSDGGDYAPPLCRAGLGADACGWVAWDKGRQLSGKMEKVGEEEQDEGYVGENGERRGEDGMDGLKG